MEEQKNIQNNEIDLYYILVVLYRKFSRLLTLIFRGLGLAFIYIGKGLYYSVKIIIGRWWLFLLLLGCSYGIAYIGEVKLPKIYKANFVAETQILPEDQFLSLINSLNDYVRYDNYTGLSHVLNMPLAEVKNISYFNANSHTVTFRSGVRSVSSSIYANGYLTQRIDSAYSSSISSSNMLHVEIKTKDKTIFESIEKGIVAMVNDHPYVKDQYQRFLTKNLAMQNSVQSQMQKLELFQNKNIEQTNNSLMIGNSPMTIVNEEKTYVEDILELQAQLSALQESYSSYKPISIVNHVIVPDKPLATMTINILILLAISWIPAIIVISVSKYRKQS